MISQIRVAAGSQQVGWRGLCKIVCHRRRLSLMLLPLKDPFEVLIEEGTSSRCWVSISSLSCWKWRKKQFPPLIFMLSWYLMHCQNRRYVFSYINSRNRVGVCTCKRERPFQHTVTYKVFKLYKVSQIPQVLGWSGIISSYAINIFILQPYTCIYLLD